VAGQEWAVAAGEAGVRLDKWLASPVRLGSRGRAASALERGQVFLNEREVRLGEAGVTLASGDRVRLWRDRPGSAAVRGPRRAGDLVIVFEDDVLLVADKPAGLLTVPAPGGGDRSLADLVATHWRSHGKREPMVVHRIDRDTSGLVIFAKDGAAWAALKGQFARGSTWPSCAACPSRRAGSGARGCGGIRAACGNSSCRPTAAARRRPSRGMP
jgi:23S rRNA pseudouridine1911/1915/1917 synthase